MEEKPVDYHAKTAVSQGEFTVVVRSRSAVRCLSRRSAQEYIARQAPAVQAEARIVQVRQPTQATPITRPAMIQEPAAQE